MAPTLTKLMNCIVHIIPLRSGELRGASRCCGAFYSSFSIKYSGGSLKGRRLFGAGSNFEDILML
jgi:hypothetical protein